MADPDRSRWYLGLATAISVLLVGTWRFNVGLFYTADVPLVAKTGLSVLALALATRGAMLRNTAVLPVALVGTVFAAGASVLLLLWAPTGLFGESPVETVVAAVTLVPLFVVLVAIQGDVDLLGILLGPRR